jgi:hypothetical protein
VKGEKCGIYICHSERSETKSKNLLAMCSLSAVCILGDPSATLGMTFIVSVGIYGERLGEMGTTHNSPLDYKYNPYFSVFTFHFSLCNRPLGRHYY